MNSLRRRRSAGSFPYSIFSGREQKQYRLIRRFRPGYHARRTERRRTGRGHRDTGERRSGDVRRHLRVPCQKRPCNDRIRGYVVVLCRIIVPRPGFPIFFRDGEEYPPYVRFRGAHRKWLPGIHVGIEREGRNFGAGRGEEKRDAGSRETGERNRSGREQRVPFLYQRPSGESRRKRQSEVRRRREDKLFEQPGAGYLIRNSPPPERTVRIVHERGEGPA